MESGTVTIDSKEWINTPDHGDDLVTIRQAINKGVPYGREKCGNGDRNGDRDNIIFRTSAPCVGTWHERADEWTHLPVLPKGRKFALLTSDDIARVVVTIEPPTAQDPPLTYARAKCSGSVAVRV